MKDDGGVIRSEGNGKRVLVVDDDPKVLRIIVHFLEGAGYEVLSTSDSTQAWALAAKFRPDLAILDITMRGKDGYDVAIQLSVSLETSKIPFMFLSARREARNADLTKKLGAFAYLQKPFKKESLLGLVRGLLSGESRLEESE